MYPECLLLSFGSVLFSHGFPERIPSLYRLSSLIELDGDNSTRYLTFLLDNLNPCASISLKFGFWAICFHQQQPGYLVSLFS